MKRGTLAALALLSPRFDPIFKTAAPLPRMDYPGNASSKNLIVFLPGIGDLAEDFERSGFIDDLRRHGIDADAVAIDAHYGYYASRAIHTRMAEDVVVIAREAGYEQVWLAGISLGGFGATSFAALQSSHISGLLLLAPYLGSNELVDEVVAAGGLGAWEPGAVPGGDYPRTVWAWLKDNFANQQPKVPIYLGYGESDRFAAANALLGDMLPSEQVVSIPGGHDWRTWKRLWQQMLPVCKTSLNAA